MAKLKTTTVTGSIQVGNDINYLQISDEGDLKLIGDATQWNDLKFPATTSKLGIQSKPDFDYTNIGLLFPQNDEAEQISIIGQISHSRKNGSNISPHIHFIQDSVDVPVFIFEYKWYCNGDGVPATFTTIETSLTPVFTYTGGTILQVVEFPMIDGSGIIAISSIIEGRIYRKTGDGVSGDVLYKEFDIHLEFDSIGSNTKYTK